MMKKAKAGFTLVELIVVIAILGILAGIAIPVYSGYIKKANQAADNQLLAAVNTAFAAACLENGVNFNDILDDGAELKYTDKGPVTGLIRVDNAGDKLDALKTSFLKYFAGNSGTSFKYYGNEHGVKFFAQKGFLDANAPSSTLSVTIGEGEDAKTYTYTQADVDAYKASNYNNVDAAELTNSVDSLASALGDNKRGLAALANTANFNAKLVELGIIGADTVVTQDMLSDAEFAQKVANASVLYVAQTASAMDSDQVYSAFVNGTIDELVEGTGVDSTFVTAALQFGLLTAFVNTEEGAAYKADFLADSQNVHGLTDVTNLFKKYTNDKNSGTYYDYAAYLESDAAATDIAGFLAALNVINENAENFDLSSVYSDESILAAIRSILGN